MDGTNGAGCDATRSRRSRGFENLYNSSNPSGQFFLSKMSGKVSPHCGRHRGAFRSIATNRPATIPEKLISVRFHGSREPYVLHRIMYYVVHCNGRISFFIRKASVVQLFNHCLTPHPPIGMIHQHADAYGVGE